MSWADELTRIRRYLRDPDGDLWSEAFLLSLYNDVQQDLQQQTRFLEDVQAIRVPGLYQFAYQHDWEWPRLPVANSQFYQCLRYHHQSSVVFCHRWESQQLAGIAADVADEGAHFTQPWEAFMSLTPGEEVRFKFPANFHSLRLIVYDREPIGYTTRKEVTSTDPSYLSRQGEPIAYYRTDDLDNSYVLYPRPATAFVNELDGGESGLVLYAAGDTEDATTGDIAVRTGSTPSANTGISVDLVDADDNLLMVYDVTPTDIERWSDESDWPAYLRKYLRYGVISRAYGANTDGRIRSLSDYWGLRYELGVQTIKRFMAKRKQDRDYRLTTKGLRARRTVRHPRLPDGYPAV